MSSAAQRAELQSQIWKIANDVRVSFYGSIGIENMYRKGYVKKRR